MLVTQLSMFLVNKKRLYIYFNFKIYLRLVKSFSKTKFLSKILYIIIKNYKFCLIFRILCCFYSCKKRKIVYILFNVASRLVTVSTLLHKHSGDKSPLENLKTLHCGNSGLTWKVVYITQQNRFYFVKTDHG